ncbi:triphosphoribosyl-dephospho-CoA synthase [Anatilimnocola floriformis]|uniref:triphosphoribosyl-dephospho-CoA synthase n=1 Tax=Anatilimnocola floriformis TaxID=2948575 RepID=UPI0020C4DC61|nr:triphosphoribosyl-dephospho-CoA synthase [Anatilimnocola floriformis]
MSNSSFLSQNSKLKTQDLSPGQAATLACLLEVTAPKVGNVHRGADFEKLTFTDFVASAVAIGPAMEHAATTGVGRAVLSAIQATRQLVSTNTNLGMVLLIAPLAAVPRGESLQVGIANVLNSLTADDSALVYEAIRLAQPGGMGEAKEMDIAAAAPPSLLAAMKAAEERDLVARQYSTNFAIVLSEILPNLLAGQQKGWSLTDNIIREHVRLISVYSDSLIARKCGSETATQASAYAAQVLAAGDIDDENYHAALSDFDFWLRADGQQRNPGTTADLIAAALFAGLRDGLLSPPYR